MKSHRFAAEVLEWAFHGTAPAWVNQAHFWISLHTEDPVVAGSTQSAGETDYPGYRRQGIGRSPTALPVDRQAREAVNAVPVEFPACTATREYEKPLTHYGIGTDQSGTGALIYSAPLDEAWTPQRRHAPRLPARAMSVKEI